MFGYEIIGLNENQIVFELFFKVDVWIDDNVFKVDVIFESDIDGLVQCLFDIQVYVGV